jgi:hypothetical protein
MNWEKLLLSAVPLFFAVMWLGILHLTAWLGGWTRLAHTFVYDGSRTEKPIQRRWFQSGSFGLMNYNSALNIAIYEEGVRIAVLWPFRPGHPPLFIPWSELREPRVRRVFPFVRRLEVQVGTPPVKVLLPVWMGEKVSAGGPQRG